MGICGQWSRGFTKPTAGIGRTAGGNRPPTGEFVLGESTSEDYQAKEVIPRGIQKAVKDPTKLVRLREPAVKAKARLCVHGLKDPDKNKLTRDSPTASRLGVIMVLIIIVCLELIMVGGDASTAFLQGGFLMSTVWKRYSQDPAGFILYQAGLLVAVLAPHVDDVLIGVKVKTLLIPRKDRFAWVDGSFENDNDAIYYGRRMRHEPAVRVRITQGAFCGLSRFASSPRRGEPRCSVGGRRDQ